MTDAAGDGDTATARRRPALLALAVVAVLLVSVGAVLVLGRSIGGHLADDDPTEATVPVTATMTTGPTRPTSTEPVVLAPPVSIDRTTTAPAG